MASAGKGKLFELKPCVDILGNTQAHGVYFTPPSSVCMQCRCNNGAKVSCITIECQRPSCKNFKQVPGKCCDYTCPNDESLSDTKTLAVVITLSLMLFFIVVAIIVVWRKMRRKKKFGKRLECTSTSSTQEDLETSLDSSLKRNSLPKPTHEQHPSQQQRQQQCSPPFSSPRSITSCSFKKDSFCEKISPRSTRTQTNNELKAHALNQHEVIVCCDGGGCCKHTTRRFEPPPPYSPPKNLAFV